MSTDAENDQSGIPDGDSNADPQIGQEIGQESTGEQRPVTRVLYSQRDFVEEMDRTLRDFPDPADEYYALFNPINRVPVLYFNPYDIQDDFDPFDIGEFINM
jgi:hypothetical protein